MGLLNVTVFSSSPSFRIAGAWSFWGVPPRGGIAGPLLPLAATNTLSLAGDAAGATSPDVVRMCCSLTRSRVDGCGLGAAEGDSGASEMYESMVWYALRLRSSS